MKGIQIEGVESATRAFSTCDEIGEIFFSRAVLRRSGKAAVPLRLVA
ncbi:hypothetical protein [Variovorax sp. Root318D1]|nr:hypothetical protein [Variovorax sp. Root318D1]